MHGQERYRHSEAALRSDTSGRPQLGTRSLATCVLAASGAYRNALSQTAWVTALQNTLSVLVFQTCRVAGGQISLRPPLRRTRKIPRATHHQSCWHSSRPVASCGRTTRARKAPTPNGRCPGYSALAKMDVKISHGVRGIFSATQSRERVEEASHELVHAEAWSSRPSDPRPTAWAQRSGRTSSARPSLRLVASRSRSGA